MKGHQKSESAEAGNMVFGSAAEGGKTGKTGQQGSDSAEVQEVVEGMSLQCRYTGKTAGLGEADSSGYG